MERNSMSASFGDFASSEANLQSKRMTPSQKTASKGQRKAEY